MEPPGTPTPGPWRWESSDEYARDVGGIHGPDDALVCWFGDAEEYYPTEGTPPKPADLSLILAAPDLYAIVKALAEDPAAYWWHGVARKALATAEGRR